MKAATATADALALSVPRDACRTIRAAHGCFVMAVQGRVWMTVEGDAEDYWLAPGEALPLAPGEQARISGWREAVRCEVQPLSQPRERRFARLRAWMRGRLAKRGLASVRAREPKERAA
ncbi:DUF2917 domain-containing protein [Paraburkholderia lycopersici]|uniref:DUF2917 domain-containing protein n=1 Tax=Paraburkholderia lycopersici TaxID=416944 RepID=A0A1G6VJR1_9BURK|nr:DUF2917 domain-containing protein [Paraburkholderia lycopersici]SDD53862.1 Protein of unknown function [Paraburkholderia lycopersici]